jgi:long-chain acyl-CoA synthetase
MLPTSGTDGLPKRVLLSHANLLANVSSFLGAAGLHAGDPGLVVLPMTSSGTNTTELLAYLSAGMTIALYPPAPFILGDFCAALGEFKATVTNLTPFILNLMLAKSGEVRPRVQTLRKIFFASAPIPVSQFERLLEAFPGVQFQYGYGLTEASPRCTMLDPSLARAKMGSAGRPIAGVDVRIIDEAGEPLPAGRTGQILVRGPNVMLGYDRQPDRTRAALAGGWLHTGDLGCLDAEGFLYVKGRIKSVIITRGVKVSPEEVEQALAGHELVQDSHVFGVADDLLGERVEARVVPRVGAHPRSPDLKEFLRRRLPAAAVPDRITVVADLGRGQTHKLPRGRPERVVATQVP